MTMYAYIKDDQLKFLSTEPVEAGGFTVIEYEGDENVIYENGQIIPKPQDDEPIE